LKKRKIIVSVISDLLSDQRVHRVCSFLEENGWEVILVGRQSRKSKPLEERRYTALRLPVYFKKGILFYAEFNLRLFFMLLFSKADAYLSNDLDTLVPNFIISRLKNKKLFYDSHEYFTGMPELAGKKFKTSIWKSIEKKLLPRIKDPYTVNGSVAAKYREDYGVEMKVVRSLPVYEEIPVSDETLFPAGKTILLLQGAGINMDRGAEELIQSMQLLPEKFLLYLIGSGEVWESLKILTRELNLEDKVCFIEKLPFQKLKYYTRQAHLGFSLDKPNSINYQVSLPNKIFDYIHAGIPVIASDIFEVRKVVEQYKIGTIIKEVNPELIAGAVIDMFSDPQKYNALKNNAAVAAKELCWQHEQNILKEIYKVL
jgi:glycosyltransferase involved in cell wall biosynthesis